MNNTGVTPYWGIVSRGDVMAPEILDLSLHKKKKIPTIGRHRS